MSDTRAAIRELRTLSEKRSLGALSEGDAARWLALRRQLGLPLEAADAQASSPPVSGQMEATQAPSLEPEGSTSLPSMEVAPITEPFGIEPQSLAPSPAAPAPATRTPEEGWAGPSLVAPTAPSAANWGGPSLDAPAWSDSVAERPTDPGVEEPPPLPFDEAPAALPPPEHTEVADFGGSPDERVPLAAASEFVSYARVGDTIDLPAETADMGLLEPQSLAQLASAGPEATPAEQQQTAEAASAPARPEAESVVQAPEADEVSRLVAELQGEEASGVDEGVVPEAPLEAMAPEALGMDAGLPPPEGMPLVESLGVFEGVLPEEPAPESLAFTAEASLDEGALSEPPLEPGEIPEEAMGVLPEPPLDALTPSPPGDEDVLARPPLQLLSPLEEVQPEEAPLPPADGSLPDAPLPDAPLPDAPLPLSTWAPGAVEPPLLAADDFARTGDPLGEGGLDPWPEALLTEVSPDDVVETIGDEDVVEELTTPTPLPLFPAATPPGSGGIRGFQFPKPPPGPVPSLSTAPGWQRTQPEESPLPRVAVPAAVVPAAVAPRTPPPTPPRPPSSVSLPVPPPPPPRAPRPAPVALRTPVATPAPTPASAVAPVTPRPTPGPGSQVPRPAPPVPGRIETLLGPPVPAPAPRPPPVLTAMENVPEETLQPLLDLVDEVEPPRAAPPPPVEPTPSPAQATAAVFGPPMMLNPSFVEGDHRVVIHTLEGQVHRGTVHDLDLQEEALAVQQPDGRSVELPTRRLKAVFFVLSPGEKPLPGRGERVQVTFRDGRQVVGYSDDHATGEPGFFVVPSDARTNTARVYVFRGGVQSITTG